MRLRALGQGVAFVAERPDRRQVVKHDSLVEWLDFNQVALSIPLPEADHRPVHAESGHDGRVVVVARDSIDQLVATGWDGPRQA